MALLITVPEFSTKIFFNPTTNSLNLKNVSNFSNYEKLGSRARVRFSRTSELDSNVRLYGQYSAPVKPSNEEEEKQNYYVNMGYAIRTLMEEFTSLFYREPSFDIYRDDIVFKDPMNTFVGIQNYKSIFWALRFNGMIFFRALWLDIIRVWQPMDNIVMVRWTVHGVPRVPWESHGRFDGTSEYKLDKNGKIYEHTVDNIALNSPLPKFRILSVEELIQSIGCPSYEVGISKSTYNSSREIGVKPPSSLTHQLKPPPSLLKSPTII